MHSTHSLKHLGLVFTCLTIIGTMVVIPALPYVQVAGQSSNVNVSITPGASTKTTDAYSPNPVAVDVGDTIIWTNNDATLHTAVSGTPSGGATGLFGGSPESPQLILQGKTQSHTFTDTGDFPYFCVLHPSMAGRVIVGQPEIIVTVRTDRFVYEIGDDVKISGEVDPVIPGQALLLRILNDEGASVRVDLVSVNENGQYQYEFPIAGGLFEPNTLYSVKVTYIKTSSETKFSVSRVEGGCEGLAPTILGTDKDDVLVGTDGNDVIDGLRGNDVIRGHDGNDIICGGPGLDEIHTGEGDDRAYGGRGNDKLYGDLGNDRLWGGTGWDKLFGGAGDDTIFGGKGNDILQGEEGNDQLDGQIGDDVLDGVQDDDGGSGFSEIEVELDDIEYQQGDDVVISGTIDGADEDEDVDITIHEPSGGSDDANTQISNEDGDFRSLYSISSSADDGIYQVELEFGTEDPLFTFFYVDEEDDTVEFSTDESSYAPGDSVEITGEVVDPEPGVEEVEITVIDPTGDEPVNSAHVDLDNNDEFEYDFDLDDVRHGRYAIVIEYDNVESGFFVIEVEEDDGGSSSITASLSRTSYMQGDMVEVVGKIEEIDPGDDVFIEVEDPNGVIIFEDNMEPESDGSFEFTFDLDVDAVLGQYFVTLVYIEESNDKVLTFNVGTPFAPWINLSNNPGFSFDPVAAASDNHVYVAWIDGSTPLGNWGLFFAKSDDYGGTFSEAAQISVRDHTAYWPAMSAVGNNVYLTWLGSDDPDGAGMLSSVIFRSSHDRGVSYENQVTIAHSDVEVGNSSDFLELGPPKIHADGDDVYVAWSDTYHVYFSVSHDKGVTFELPKVLASGSQTKGQIDDVHVSGSGEHVHVAWHLYGGSSDIVFVRSSHDRGATFEPSVSVSNNGRNEGSWILQMLTSDENVYLSWQHSSRFGGSSIVFVSSNDNGATYNSPELLGGVFASSAAGPVMAASGSEVYVLWGGFSLSLAISHDGGRNFEPVSTLSTGFGDFPLISAAERNVYIAWRTENPGSSNTWFSSSSDGGAVFIEATTILENHPDVASNMAASGDRAFVIRGGEEVSIMKVAG